MSKENREISNNKTTNPNQNWITGGIIGGIVCLMALGAFVFPAQKESSNVPSNTNDKNIVTKKNTTTKKTTTTTKKAVNIVASKNKTITYDTYKTNYISIKIPKGWKVQEDTTSFAYYVLRAYDPTNEDYQIFFNFKTDGFTKSAKAKNYYTKRASNSPQAYLPVLNPGTTENYFNIFSDTSGAIALMNKGLTYYPKLDNFTMTDNLGKINVGGDILRGSYKGKKGNAEGIFTATVKEMNAVKIGSIDVSYYLVYYTAFVTTPEGELINWENILLKSLGSLEFSSSFETGFYKELNQNAKTASFNRRQSQIVSEGIMDSWNKRQKSLDIQSQKRSDATLGYERVYDTETGEIYKAYNGFTSDYRGTRYKAISDSQYSESIAGYIEK